MKQVKIIADELGANKEPLRREIMKALATALDIAGDHPGAKTLRAYYAQLQKTNKKLELRDYNIENNNPQYGFDDKHKGFYQLVKHMQNSGIPIDAVGIQVNNKALRRPYFMMFSIRVVHPGLLLSPHSEGSAGYNLKGYFLPISLASSCQR